MAKTQTKIFRLSDETINLLQTLAHEKGLNMTEVIEDALQQYAKPSDDVSRILLETYASVSSGIERLERIRDTNPVTNDYMADDENYLSQEGNALLSLLWKAWEELREHPLFWEPKVKGIND